MPEIRDFPTISVAVIRHPFFAASLQLGALAADSGELATELVRCDFPERDEDCFVRGAFVCCRRRISQTGLALREFLGLLGGGSEPNDD
jgi:hypothetical protein